MKRLDRVRERNPRGQGNRLADEIIDAATALLDETGREDALTLRAVARQANITAPSIYSHFADREAILTAVISRAFTELIVAVEAGMDGLTDPVERLHGGCEGYLRFATEQPQQYRVLFGRRADPATPAEPEPVELSDLIGSQAFAILVDSIAACVAAGRSSSTDPFADACILWSAMHGYASLSAGAPDFPWAPRAYIVPTMINELAKIRPV